MRACILPICLIVLSACASDKQTRYTRSCEQVADACFRRMGGGNADCEARREECRADARVIGQADRAKADGYEEFKKQRGRTE